jgi:hypothetical protein
VSSSFLMYYYFLLNSFLLYCYFLLNSFLLEQPKKERPNKERRPPSSSVYIPCSDCLVRERGGTATNTLSCGVTAHKTGRLLGTYKRSQSCFARLKSHFEFLYFCASLNFFCPYKCFYFCVSAGTYILHKLLRHIRSYYAFKRTKACLPGTD